MATINIGRLKPVFQGAYDNAQGYVVDDIVTYSGETYICILASTGNVPTNTTYWSKMASKGADGVDADLFSIAGTAQGDLYYNNGSAIARLPAGSANQVLQSGGAGANPSWGTLSSDFVKIVEATGAGTNALALDSCFSSTYENYLIVGNLHTSGGNSNVAIRLQNASNTEVNTQYYYVGYQAYVNSGASAGDIKSGWNQAEYFPNENHTPDTASFAQYIVWVNKPFISSTHTHMQSFYNAYDGAQVRYVHSVIQHKTAQSNAGFRFFMGNGSHNITNLSKVRVYGLK